MFIPATEQMDPKRQKQTPPSAMRGQKRSTHRQSKGTEGQKAAEATGQVARGRRKIGGMSPRSSGPALASVDSEKGDSVALGSGV